MQVLHLEYTRGTIAYAAGGETTGAKIPVLGGVWGHDNRGKLSRDIKLTKL